MSTWIIDPPMPTGLVLPGSCVDSQGRIYVVGGTDGSVRKRANRYDPATDSWTALPDMANVRYMHAVVCLSNDHVIAIGGNGGTVATATVEEYNPVSNTWTTIAPLPAPRQQFGCVVTETDDIYVTGGLNTNIGGAGGYSNTIFRLRAGTWTTLTAFTTARFDHACVHDNEFIIVAGGVDTTGFEHITVEQYEIATDAWTVIDPLSIGRRTMAVVTDDFLGIAYLIGGQAASAYTDLTESIDISAGTNQVLAPMNVPRTGPAFAIDLQGRPIVAGGINSIGVGYLDSSERYDPDTDNWEALDGLVYAHIQDGGAYTDQRMHIFGGAAVDLSDFDPIITDGTFTQSILLPSVARGGGGGGGGGGSPSGGGRGRGQPSAGFIPITNLGSGFDGFPGDELFPSDDLFPMDA